MSTYNKKIKFTLKDKLNKLDTENQTYGCRHSNPDICGSCFIENVCAFMSKDSICKKPSSSWKKRYKELLKEQQNEE